MRKKDSDRQSFSPLRGWPATSPIHSLVSSTYGQYSPSGGLDYRIGSRVGMRSPDILSTISGSGRHSTDTVSTMSDRYTRALTSPPRGGICDPVVVNAGFTFRLTEAKPMVHNHVQVDPASLVPKTQSSYLTKEIDKFLKKSDHTLDRFKEMVTGKSPPPKPPRVAPINLKSLEGGSEYAPKTTPALKRFAVGDSSTECISTSIMPPESGFSKGPTPPPKRLAINPSKGLSPSPIKSLNASVAEQAERHRRILAKVMKRGQLRPSTLKKDVSTDEGTSSSSSTLSLSSTSTTEDDLEYHSSPKGRDKSDDTSAEISKLEDLSSGSDEEFFDVQPLPGYFCIPGGQPQIKQGGTKGPIVSGSLSVTSSVRAPLHSCSLPAVNKLSPNAKMGNTQPNTNTQGKGQLRKHPAPPPPISREPSLVSLASLDYKKQLAPPPPVSREPSIVSLASIDHKKQRAPPPPSRESSTLSLSSIDYRKQSIAPPTVSRESSFVSVSSEISRRSLDCSQLSSSYDSTNLNGECTGSLKKLRRDPSFRKYPAPQPPQNDKKNGDKNSGASTGTSSKSSPQSIRKMDTSNCNSVRSSPSCTQTRPSPTRTTTKPSPTRTQSKPPPSPTPSRPSPSRSQTRPSPSRSQTRPSPTRSIEKSSPQSVKKFDMRPPSPVPFRSAILPLGKGEQSKSVDQENKFSQKTASSNSSLMTSKSSSNVWSLSSRYSFPSYVPNQSEVPNTSNVKSHKPVSLSTSASTSTIPKHLSNFSTSVFSSSLNNKDNNPVNNNDVSSLGEDSTICNGLALDPNKKEIVNCKNKSSTINGTCNNLSKSPENCPNSLDKSKQIISKIDGLQKRVTENKECVEANRTSQNNNNVSEKVDSVKSDSEKINSVQGDSEKIKNIQVDSKKIEVVCGKSDSNTVNITSCNKSDSINSDSPKIDETNDDSKLNNTKVNSEKIECTKSNPKKLGVINSDSEKMDSIKKDDFENTESIKCDSENLDSTKSDFTNLESSSGDSRKLNGTKSETENLEYSKSDSDKIDSIINSLTEETSVKKVKKKKKLSDGRPSSTLKDSGSERSSRASSVTSSRGVTPDRGLRPVPRKTAVSGKLAALANKFEVDEVKEEIGSKSKASQLTGLTSKFGGEKVGKLSNPYSKPFSPVSNIFEKKSSIGGIDVSKFGGLGKPRRSKKDDENNAEVAIKGIGSKKSSLEKKESIDKKNEEGNGKENKNRKESIEKDVNDKENKNEENIKKNKIRKGTTEKLKKEETATTSTTVIEDSLPVSKDVTSDDTQVTSGLILEKDKVMDIYKKEDIKDDINKTCVDKEICTENKEMNKDNLMEGDRKDDTNLLETSNDVTDSNKQVDSPSSDFIKKETNIVTSDFVNEPNNISGVENELIVESDINISNQEIDLGVETEKVSHNQSTFVESECINDDNIVKNNASDIGITSIEPEIVSKSSENVVIKKDNSESKVAVSEIENVLNVEAELSNNDSTKDITEMITDEIRSETNVETQIDEMKEKEIFSSEAEVEKINLLKTEITETTFPTTEGADVLLEVAETVLTNSEVTDGTEPTLVSNKELPDPGVTDPLLPEPTHIVDAKDETIIPSTTVTEKILSVSKDITLANIPVTSDLISEKGKTVSSEATSPNEVTSNEASFMDPSGSVQVTPVPEIVSVATEKDNVISIDTQCRSTTDGNIVTGSLVVIPDTFSQNTNIEINKNLPQIPHQEAIVTETSKIHSQATSKENIEISGTLCPSQLPLLDKKPENQLTVEESSVSPTQTPVPTDDSNVYLSCDTPASAYYSSDDNIAALEASLSEATDKTLQYVSPLTSSGVTSAALSAPSVKQFIDMSRSPSEMIYPKTRSYQTNFNQKSQSLLQKVSDLFQNFYMKDPKTITPTDSTVEPVPSETVSSDADATINSVNNVPEVKLPDSQPVPIFSSDNLCDFSQNFSSKCEEVKREFELLRPELPDGDIVAVDQGALLSVRPKVRKTRGSTSTPDSPTEVLNVEDILRDADERLSRALSKQLSPSPTNKSGDEEQFIDAYDPSHFDTLMPLPNADDINLIDRRSRSSTPFLERTERSPTPKKVFEETEAILAETDRILRKSRSQHSLRRSFTKSLSGANLNRLTEVSADLAEEHGTAQLASERIEAEQSERMRLEKEVAQLQVDFKKMTSVNGKLEMEKLTLRNEMLQHVELNGDVDDDDTSDVSLYKRKYDWAMREMEVLKKQLKQQQEDDLDQLLILKKQLEKKVTDAYEETDEQRQVVGQMKKKSQRLQAEMNDMKILLEEQTSRNNLLEKKQRKFDQDMQAVVEEQRGERLAKEKVQRERDTILSEKYSYEQEVSTLKLELDLKEEKVAALTRELSDLQFTGKAEEEVAILKKAKHDLELRVKDQEEELDDLAGQVQMLESARVRLEMSIEQMRKENRKELSQRDEELEEVRLSAQKKIKALESQLESEHDERTGLVREKHDLERRLVTAQSRSFSTVDEDSFHRVKKELKKTKALLKDTQTMLEKSQSEGSNKLLMRQLKTQLEDAEFAKNAAIKARQSTETDYSEVQSQLEEAQRAKKDTEDKLARISKEKSEIQTQLEESEEEVAEVMKKYKATVSQLSVDQINISEQAQLIADLEHDKQVLQDKLTELTSKVEVLEGETANIHTQRRLQMKIKEVESKLDLELTTRTRLESQITRLKDQVERMTAECDSVRQKESQAVDHGKKLNRQLREAKEDAGNMQQKLTDASSRKQEVEKQFELAESEIITLKSDLKLAFKRIEDLQQALQGDLSDSDSEISESKHDVISSPTMNELMSVIKEDAEEDYKESYA